MLYQSHLQLHNDIPPLWWIHPWCAVSGGQIHTLSQCLGQRVQPDVATLALLLLTVLLAGVRGCYSDMTDCWILLQHEFFKTEAQSSRSSNDSLSSLSSYTFREVERLGTQVRKSTMIQQKSIRTEWKLAKIAFVVIVIYVLSWSPYACVTLISWAG